MLRSLPIASVLTVALACAAPLGDAPVSPVSLSADLVDVLHYDIDVDIDHRAGHVQGRVTVTFAAPADRAALALQLDAVELSIAGAWDDQGRELLFDVEPALLTVHLAEPVLPGQVGVVSVDYAGYPRRGLYIVPPHAADPDRPWHIWTQGQPHETRHWIPVVDRLDDFATHRLRVTVDGSFDTLAAGERSSSRVSRATGRRTDVWQIDVPHPIELLTLVSGGLAHDVLPDRGVPLPLVAEAGSMPWAKANLAATGEMLEVLGDWAGLPYPYPKYAQACVKQFVAGGMENVSATTLFHETLHDPADEPQVDSTDLVAHEAAHQWFGDTIGARTWDHLWLNESFATYAEIIWREHERGRDDARALMREYRRAAVAAEEGHSRPIVWDGWATPDDTFASHAYEGGAARLHLLRAILGEPAFTAGVRHYVAEHRGHDVVTEDLRASLEAATGVELARFFHEFVYGAGLPVFRVRQLTGREGDPLNVLRILQTQGESGLPELFHLPVTVSWSRGGVERSERVEIDDVEELVVLAGEGGFDWVAFDSQGVVPGRIDFDQPESMWRNQLRAASDPLLRLTAAEWFGGHPDVRPDVPEDWRPEGGSQSVLLGAVRDDAFPAVRVEALLAAAAWAEADDPDLSSMLLRALSDSDPRLREAAAEALAGVGEDDVLPHLVAAVGDDNASVVAAALNSLVARGYPGAFALCRDTAAATDKMRLDRDIVHAVAQIDDPRSRPFLIAAARTEAAPSVRAAAIDELAWQTDEHRVIHHLLCQELYDESHLVRAAAARALATRGEAGARQALEVRASIEGDGFVLATIEGALQRL